VVLLNCSGDYNKMACPQPRTGRRWIYDAIMLPSRLLSLTGRLSAEPLTGTWNTAWEENGLDPPVPLAGGHCRGKRSTSSGQMRGSAFKFMPVLAESHIQVGNFRTLPPTLELVPASMKTSSTLQ
jgi:hypothetical protein